LQQQASSQKPKDAVKVKVPPVNNKLDARFIASRRIKHCKHKQLMILWLLIMLLLRMKPIQPKMLL